MKKAFLILFFFSSVILVAQDQYTWNEKMYIPAVGRHRASGCAVNNRGYIGLGHVNNVMGEIIYDDWWEYDPGTDTWMQKANFAGGVRYHAICFSIGNYAYVGTGSGNFGDNDDLWRYNPVSNTWTFMSTVPGGVRSGAVAFSINGKGYVALGDFQNDCWEYDPVANSWTPKANSIVSGYSSVAAVQNGKAYVGVGSGTSWAEFNPATNQWTMKAMFPGVSRFGSGCFSYDGWVYVVSGSNWSEEFSDAWAYNPTTNQWVQVSDFPGQARHYFVCFSLGNRVYGGTGTSGTNYNDFWEYGNLAAGVDENAGAAAKFFPNPVVDKAQFDIDHSLASGSTFEVFDLNGRQVTNEDVSSASHFIFSRNDLAAGTYIYHITENNQLISNGKIILQ